MTKKCRKFYDWLSAKDPIIMGGKAYRTKDRNNINLK